MSDKKISRPKEPSEKKEKKIRNNKVLKHTTMATVLTVVFIAVVVMINTVASIVFDRYPLTIDLTDNDKYSISQDSIDYVKSIENDIKVTVLADTDTYASINEYTVQAQELLKRYQEYNSNISVEYVDLLKNPEVTSNYTDVDLQDYDIIFETYITGDDGERFQRIKIVSLGDLVSWSAELTEQFSQYGYTIEDMSSYYGAATVMNYYGSYISGSNAESAFTSALMTITDPNPIDVTVLTGHKEVTELNYFKKLLAANGYNLTTINIITEEIPEDTDLLIVGAPAEDYLENDVKKISDFLVNDGKLEKDMVYIASVQQGETPNLDEFLEEYGIKVEKALVLEGDTNAYYMSPIYTTPSIVSDNYKQDLATDDYMLIMQSARPIKLLFESQDMVTTEAFAQSSSSAFTCSYDENGFDADDILEKGTQTSIAIGSKAVFIGEDTGYSNIMVISSEMFVDDSYLQATQFQNSEYMISLLNGMTKKTSTGLVIATKTITGNTFDLTARQASILKWTFQAVIPAIVLIAGLVIYKRRKNR